MGTAVAQQGRELRLVAVAMVCLPVMVSRDGES